MVILSYDEEAQDIYSESDDDMCHVKDENEEMSVFGALSLFLKSPKNMISTEESGRLKQEDFP